VQQPEAATAQARAGGLHHRQGGADGHRGIEGIAAGREDFLYYFSSYNYKMTGRILKYTDILKGKWIELPPQRRYTTSIIMAMWIFILIVIDLLLKFLNALTLSINTFTTLGFGEIPIKGIPRYLAIIQGFIGWFMLTIFSVSLISQLLN